MTWTPTPKTNIFRGRQVREKLMSEDLSQL